MKKNTKKCEKICLVNLGCHKNQVDSEIIIGVLDDAGYQFISDPEDADIIIVNTCGFLQAAREESVEMLLLMNSYRKKGRLKKLVVAGCMADKDRHYLTREVRQIDQFISPFHLDRAAFVLQESHPVEAPVSSGLVQFPKAMRWITTPPSYGYLKISDGCNNQCAYCRIPFLRGSFQSKPPDDVILESAEIIDSGRREIVIISQDTTAYGTDNPLYGDFTGLLSQIVKIPGLRWLRLMYLHPAGISDTLLQFIADHPVICRYLDIPLQHTDPEVLKRMNRRIPGTHGSKTDRIYSFLEHIRKSIRGVAIRTTLMTGYPGETEKAFRNMLELVDSGAFDHLGVFSWSPEPDTAAFAYRQDAVDRYTAEERAAMLLSAQAEIVEARSQERLGSECLIVIDGPDETVPGYVLGRTEFQAPEVDGWVRVRGNYSAGSWLQVRLTGVDMYDYQAVVPEKN